MATIAILSRLQNDPFVRVIEIDDGATMDEVAAACAAPAIGYHTAHPDPAKPLRVRRTTATDTGEPLPGGLTAKEAALAPFDCIDVFVE
jgi:toluene monooxygenase system protein B